jgi:purine catabolism regulator
VPITVRDLLDLPGLGLTVVAGRDGLDNAVRWAHTSELPDPTRWLSGGELLLTTGLGPKGSPTHQRAYVKKLVKARVAGIGFGVGFGFDEAPGPLLRAADREGLPVLEVPYPVPFIAIAEAVSMKLAEERMAELQMSVDVHERLAHLVAEGSGPADVLNEMVAIAPGWVYLFDPDGHLVAAAGSEPGPPADAVWSHLPAGLLESGGPTTSSALRPEGSELALAVTSGKHVEGVLVFGRGRPIDAVERVVVRHAATVLGLLLAAQRTIVSAERRVAADLLADALRGTLEGAEVERRLELVGFSPAARVAPVVFHGGIPIDKISADELASSIENALRERCEARVALVDGRMTAIVASTDPVGLAREIVQRFGDRFRGPLDEGGVRAGVGEPVAPADLARSYASAVVVLEFAPAERRIVSIEDMGSYALLLSAQSRPMLDAFVRSTLGPLIDRDSSKGSELIASVKAFVLAGGRWEEGAEALGIHRHTLRYRINQAQELIDRDLSVPEDRMEIWLALRALELLER